MKTWIRTYCLLAGLCDAATGAALLAAPGWVFAALALGPLPAPAAFASFVGAFVLAVGLAYLYPWLLDAGRRASRIQTVLEVTALSRLSVAAFLAVALARGLLAPWWGVVLATDLGLGLFQLTLTSRQFPAGAEAR
jgi:hypothetical protein